MQEVAEQFAIEGEVTSVQPVKVGLIHQSFKVLTTADAYFLQKVNHHVFKDVAGMMANIQLVTNHLSETWKDKQFETLKLVAAKDGNYLMEVGGEWWRMYKFKSHLIGKDHPVSIAEVQSAAGAFAAFGKALQSIDTTQLVVTIPKFHSLRHRLNQLNDALLVPKDRSGEAIQTAAVIHELAMKLVVLEDHYTNGELPTRVTHNDTKFNNLLLDSNGIARCVVDLDTIMPGIVHFDVGDALRTIAATAKEDEADLGLVELNTAYYDAFLSAYTTAWGSTLTALELRLMPYAAPYMAIIMAVRFITDQLNGSIYYQCNYATHNLVRAKNQLKMARLLAAQGGIDL
jgi:aminoglycoside phosphotransferase (APT) family kinase protein